MCAHQIEANKCHIIYSKAALLASLSAPILLRCYRTETVAMHLGLRYDRWETVSRMMGCSAALLVLVSLVGPLFLERG